MNQITYYCTVDLQNPKQSVIRQKINLQQLVAAIGWIDMKRFSVIHGPQNVSMTRFVYRRSWSPDNEIYSLWYSPDFSSLVQWNMSTMTTWIVTIYSDVHDSQTMNPIYIGNPLNFLLTPPWGSHLCFRIKNVKNSWMFCQKICYRHYIPHQKRNIIWYICLIEKIPENKIH